MWLSFPDFILLLVLVSINFSFFLPFLSKYNTEDFCIWRKRGLPFQTFWSHSSFLVVVKCCMLLHYAIPLVHFAFHWFCFVYRNCDIYFCFSSKWNYNFIFWNIFELPLVSICYTMSLMLSIDYVDTSDTTTSTLYLMCLQISQATQLCCFQKKLT